MNPAKLDRLTSFLIWMSATAFITATPDLRPAHAQNASTLPAVQNTSGSALADSLDLDAYRGRVVYLDFWASWCDPCRKAFPWMETLHKQYEERGLVVLAVNLDKARKSADAFLAANPASFRIFYDPEGKLATEYRLEGLPSSFLIDRRGTLRDRHVGFRKEDAERMRGEILKLLDEETPAPAEGPHPARTSQDGPEGGKP